MRRSRYQIISQILEICIGGASKTRIVYQANLNFRTVNQHIDILTNSGMLNVKQGSNIIYETTEKGTKFLKSIKEVNNNLSKL